MKGREWRLPKLGWTLLLLQIAFAATQVHVLLGLSIEASSQFLDFTSHCTDSCPHPPPVLNQCQARTPRRGHTLFISNGSRVTQGINESMHADVSSGPSSINR